MPRKIPKLIPSIDKYGNIQFCPKTSQGADTLNPIYNIRVNADGSLFIRTLPTIFGSGMSIDPEASNAIKVCIKPDATPKPRRS